jgi:hypothetical protein
LSKKVDVTSLMMNLRRLLLMRCRKGEKSIKEKEYRIQHKRIKTGLGTVIVINHP